MKNKLYKIKYVCIHINTNRDMYVGCIANQWKSKYEFCGIYVYKNPVINKLYIAACVASWYVCCLCFKAAINTAVSQ